MYISHCDAPRYHDQTKNNPERISPGIFMTATDDQFTFTTLSSGLTSASRWLRSIPKADSCDFV